MAEVAHSFISSSMFKDVFLTPLLPMMYRSALAFEEWRSSANKVGLAQSAIGHFRPVRLPEHYQLCVHAGQTLER